MKPPHGLASTGGVTELVKEFDMTNRSAVRRQNAWTKYLDTAKLPNVRERIMRHVMRDDNGCWIWTSAKSSRGYGIIVAQGETMLAHRLSALVFRGTFDPALDVDHLCRVTLCVNPDHLEPVPHKVNVQRGVSFGVVRDVCPNGHKYPENAPIRRHGDRTYRACLACVRERRGRNAPEVRTSNFAQQTVCPNGHRYTDATTSIAKNGNRRCKTCHNERCARARARRAQKLSA